MKRGDIESVKKVKDTFRACRNYDAIAASGFTPLMDLLREIGGWPVLKRNWDERKFNFMDVNSKLAEHFINVCKVDNKLYAIQLTIYNIQTISVNINIINCRIIIIKIIYN